MLGSLIGKVLSAPVRIANVPVKLAQKAAEAADEAVLGQSCNNYRAPKRNSLNKLSDAIQSSCEEALDE